ncbi:hypothetical protein ACP70R_032758 [Stipagrostis hirtigluma subsp. patula]
MQMSMLKDLVPGTRRNWTVCARVSRIWDYRGGTDDGDILHVGLVLLDSEGTAMYAEIGADDVDEKKPLLAEGKIYKFQRFRVINCRPNFRPVECKFMIDITYHTLIVEEENPVNDFPLYVYTLTKFADLPGLIGENKRFIDVVGFITEVSGLEPVHFTSQRPSTVRKIVILRDGSNYQMKLILWGQRARDFNDAEIEAMGQQEPVVAIIVGALMKSYTHEPCLSGNSACHWYINPDVPEANHLLDSLHEAFEPVKRIAIEGQGSAQRPAAAQPQQKTLQELQPISPYDFPPEGFICTVTISRVNEDQGWWFPSCNQCSRTSYPDGSGYSCSACDCKTVKYKYKICLNKCLLEYNNTSSGAKDPLAVVPSGSDQHIKEASLSQSTPPPSAALDSPPAKTAPGSSDDNAGKKTARKCLFGDDELSDEVADYESPVAESELDGYGLDIRKKSSLIPSKIEDDLSKKVSQSKKVKRN